MSAMAENLNSEKAFYERLGVPCYWVIDPMEPRLTAFELGREGEYERIVKVAGSEVFDAANPFPARVVPAELIDRRRKA